jgi:hypothetical protein
MPNRMVMYDLRAAARSYSEEGMRILIECMKDTKAEWPVRLKAIELLWERGYGKPEIRAAIETEHRFVVAPQTMPVGQWLERKGQPAGQEGDRWLESQRATPPERRASEAPTAATGHSSGAQVIDVAAEDPTLLDPDPTCPPPPGSKVH